MKEKKSRFRLFLTTALMLTALLFSFQPAQAATFFGESPEPGFHEYQFKNGRYQVYLPSTYVANRHFPVVILSYVYMGNVEVRPEDYFDSWRTIAEERQYIIIFPMPGGDVDFLDQWAGEFLKMIQIQYPMKRANVLLTGFGIGAHYAIHFGLEHPKDIGAVAAIAGGMEGPWKPMMSFKRAENRPSFYLAGADKDAVVPIEEVESAANLLKKKGYSVEFEKNTGGHEYTEDMAGKIADWFDRVRNG